jgi:hypothetical protein
MTELTEKEQKAIDRYTVANNEAIAADYELDKIFRLTYEPLLEAGRIEEAQEYVKRLPECVAKMYARDAIRAARGDFD